MKVSAISDLHGYLPVVEPCDVLVIAGDICPFMDHRVSIQAEFINDDFAQWLCEVPASHIVGIAGNHDFVFERSPHLVREDLRWTYLQDRETCVDGLRVYGTPWCPIFLDWAFNLGEKRLAEKWEQIPEGIDILITHTPPYGYGDRTSDGRHAGSMSLRERLELIDPQLIVFGHIHEARGGYRLFKSDESTLRLANVSHLNARGAPVHRPVEFDVTPRQNNYAAYKDR